MTRFTHAQIFELWPHWPKDEFARFWRVVVGVPKADGYTATQFITMATERWLHGVTRFNEATRHHVCQALLNSLPFREHVVDLVEDRCPLVGFYVTVCDDRWVTWVGHETFIDTTTFETVEQLPEPHVWSTILGITPMYHRLCRDLETRDVANEAQGSERPQTDPPRQ